MISSKIKLTLPTLKETSGLNFWNLKCRVRSINFAFSWKTDDFDEGRDYVAFRAPFGKISMCATARVKAPPGRPVSGFKTEALKMRSSVGRDSMSDVSSPSEKSGFSEQGGVRYDCFLFPAFHPA